LYFYEARENARDKKLVEKAQGYARPGSAHLSADARVFSKYQKIRRWIWELLEIDCFQSYQKSWIEIVFWVLLEML
jgi:hypothetical protein